MNVTAEERVATHLANLRGRIWELERRLARETALREQADKNSARFHAQLLEQRIRSIPAFEAGTNAPRVPGIPLTEGMAPLVVVPSDGGRPASNTTNNERGAPQHHPGRRGAPQSGEE